MKCRQVKKLVMDYLDSTLPAAQSCELELHLQHCARCREGVESMRVVGETLRNLPQQQASADFWERLEARLPQRLSLSDRLVARLEEWLQLPTRRWAMAGVGLAIASLLIFVTVKREGVEPTVTQHQPSVAYVMQCVEQHAVYAGDQTMPELSVPDPAVMGGNTTDYF